MFLGVIAKMGEPAKFGIDMTKDPKAAVSSFLTECGLEMTEYIQFGEKLDMEPFYCIALKKNRTRVRKQKFIISCGFIQHLLNVHKMKTKGTLIFFCGKMGAGKSTYSKKLAGELNAVYLSEDEWLASLYPEDIKTFNDYIERSSRLKSILKEHVRSILQSGISVVMDFPGNTKKQRAWFKSICPEGQFPHKLFYLLADDSLCLQRLAERRKTLPERVHFDTEEVFYQVTAFFEEPVEDEGFNLEIVEQNEI